MKKIRTLFLHRKNLTCMLTLLLIILCGFGLVGEILLSPGLMVAFLMALADSPNASQELHNWTAWPFYLFFGTLIAYPFLYIICTLIACSSLKKNKPKKGLYYMLIPAIPLFYYLSYFYLLI